MHAYILKYALPIEKERLHSQVKDIGRHYGTVKRCGCVAYNAVLALALQVSCMAKRMTSQQCSIISPG